MTDILLKALNNADINWLIAAGQQQQLKPGAVLLRPRETPEALFLLLQGSLGMAVPQSGGECAESRQRTAVSVDREIARFLRGEMVGIGLLFNAQPLDTTIRAVEDATVLAIPYPKLAAKLQQDSDFSARFYRAIALILSERLQQMLAQSGQLREAIDQPMKEVLFVFGELRDSDVDWLVGVGHLEKLAARAVLMQAGRPLDALYIVLDGLLSVAVHEGETSMLTLCFECVEESAPSQKVIDRLSRGEISGSVSLLNSSPSPVTVRAIEESLVLAIPRSELNIRLQQDMGFATRFYRVLAVQLLETLRTAIGLLGCPQQRMQREMDAGMQYEDELNLDSLHQVAQGAARFNWMLKRLGVT